MGIARLLLIIFSVLGAASAHAQHVRRDIAYAANGQTLDIYGPVGPVRKTTLLFIHGGGFTQGDKSQLAGFSRLYAQGGFTAATMNYRLAPAHPYPAAVDDVKSAILWLRKNGATRIVLIGYSAGGTLALSAGFSKDVSVDAIVSAAAPVDLQGWVDSVPFDKAKADLAGYLQGARAREASPLYATRAGQPPVFLVHGSKDPMVPIAQSVSLAEKLRGENLPVLFRIIPKAGHDILLTPKYIKQVLKDLTPFLVAIDSPSR
jgi:acetyl esterase/lipase